MYSFIALHTCATRDRARVRCRYVCMYSVEPSISGHHGIEVLAFIEGWPYLRGKFVLQGCIGTQQSDLYRGVAFIRLESARYSCS